MITLIYNAGQLVPYGSVDYVIIIESLKFAVLDSNFSIRLLRR